MKEQKEVLVLTPDSLLQVPCEPVGPGDTVRSLAKAYVKNTSCIKEFKLLLDKQQKYKQSVTELYNNGGKR